MAFQSKPCMEDGLFFDIQNPTRLNANAVIWVHISLGLLGHSPLNRPKLEEEEEGRRWRIHTMIGFTLKSPTLAFQLPDAKIAGPRVLFERTKDNYGPHAMESRSRRKILGRIAHLRASNSIGMFLTCPTDRLLQYTDGRSVWVNCPVPEIWPAF